EIEMEEVGPIGIVAARVPRVEIDAAQVDEPEQGWEVLHDRELHEAGRVLDAADVDPLRPRLRRAFHVEEIALRAVRVALHDHCALDDVREEVRRDVRVVLQEIALGDLQCFPEEFAQVGEAHFAVAEAEGDVVGVGGDDERFRCHDAAVYSAGIFPLPPGGRWRGVSSVVYSSSRLVRTARSISPPRDISPSPANDDGKRSRLPKIGQRTSTYLPVATLP